MRKNKLFKGSIFERKIKIENIFGNNTQKNEIENIIIYFFFISCDSFYNIKGINEKYVSILEIISLIMKINSIIYNVETAIKILQIPTEPEHLSIKCTLLCITDEECTPMSQNVKNTSALCR